MFKSPKDCFGTFAPRAVAELAAASADIALVVDAAGTIKDLAVQDPEFESVLGASHDWIGQSWYTLLNAASHGRAKTLLADAAAGKPASRRNLNHVARDGTDSPVLYGATSLHDKTKVVLFGRDLRPVAALQQRLMDAQHSIERDHLRIRQLELRHRALLSSAPEPLLVLNAATQKITDTNPAMASLLGRTQLELMGLPVLELFDPADRAAVAATLSATRAGAAAQPLQIHLTGGRPAAGQAGPAAAGLTLSTSLFRDDHALFVLLRLIEPTKAPQRREGVVTQDQPSLLQLLEQAPDGLVVTDATGRIQVANPAFLAMAELAQQQEAVGQSLGRWLAPGGVDLDILLTNLRQRGTVQLFNSSLAGASGLSNAVEISAVTLASSSIGFAIRDVGRRVVEQRPGRDMPRSVDQLTELIGRVPLKDLVREATDMVERLCIEAALEMTRDNRASAADLLGLSRQSLYVKLRRYGLGDLTDQPA